MFNIRNANQIDLPAIVEIYNSAIPGRLATGDLQYISVESRISWFKDRSPNRPIWVIELDNNMVGWLSFQSFYGRPAYESTAEISIYVNPNYQGQGIGKYLLNEAISQCSQLGLKTLLALIFAHNEPSLKLFQYFGFQCWGHLPKIAELDNLERDLLILGLRIANS